MEQHGKVMMTATANSGFLSGAPRKMNYKGVREGREKGGYPPRTLGAGRTGKGPAAVPQSMLRALGVKVGVLETIEEKALKQAEAGSEMKTRWKDIDRETESEIWRVLEPLGVFVNIYTPYMTLWLRNTTDERATSVLKETPALYGYLVTQERIAVERLRAAEAKEAGDQLPDNHESNVKEIDSLQGLSPGV